MIDKKQLNQAVDFHGHLGPYLVLGLTCGKYGLKELKAVKHFGIEAKVYGALKRPKSCLIDGLQISTGATFGKGNIVKRPSRSIRINLKNKKSGKRISFKFSPWLIKSLGALKGHRDSERFATRLLKIKPSRMFTTI